MTAEEVVGLVGLEPARIRVQPRPDLGAVEVVFGPDGALADQGEAFLFSADQALALALALARASGQCLADDEP